MFISFATRLRLSVVASTVVVMNDCFRCCSDKHQEITKILDIRRKFSFLHGKHGKSWKLNASENLLKFAFRLQMGRRAVCLGFALKNSESYSFINVTIIHGENDSSCKGLCRAPSCTK